jgi:acetylornithine deacetylase/succinyl-diaminopimelate desuccinylase-like protein
MRSEDDVRTLLDDCLGRARAANLQAETIATDSPEGQRAIAEHLVWVNVAQALRWVLDELETFTPVRLDSPFTAPIRRGIVAAQGEEPLLVPAMGGSLPNYVFTGELGIPAFVVPYANPDEANHAPNENLEIARFMMGVKTGAAILAHLGAMKA